MQNKKKIWIPIVAALLAVAVGAGALVAYRMTPQEAAVFPVTMVGYTDYYSGSSESYGQITTDKVQTLYISSTQTVTEILVYAGQEVKKGDVLFTYDTTLSDLAIERKDLSIQQLEANLKNAQAELKELNKLKPIVIKPGTTEPPSGSDSDYSKSPKDAAKLNTVYSTRTTGRSSRSPFYFWLGRNTQITEAMIEDMFELAGGSARTIYVVFQITRLDKPNTEFSQEYGVSYTKVTETAPTEPTQPSEPTDPGSPSDPSDPSDPSEPSEPDPTETTAPTEPPESTVPPTEPAPSEPAPSEPVPSEPAPSDPAPSEPAPSEPAGAAVSLHTTSGAGTVLTSYQMRFFDPSGTTNSDDDGSVDWNSGYTSAELTAMKNEKKAQISQLQFDIRMAKAELKIMKKEADSGQVTAEFDGVVAHVTEPSVAIETGEPLIKVSGGGGYYVEGTISELELDTIQPGQQVTVTSWDTGEVCTGTVTEVGTYPAEEQNYYGSANVSYYPYKVFIDESANLMEGFYVSMTYQTPDQASGTLYLQNAFLRKDGNRVYVFVRNAEGLLEKRYLDAGVSTDGYMTPIYGGITEEDYLAFPYGREAVEGALTYEGTDQDLYGY